MIITIDNLHSNSEDFPLALKKRLQSLYKLHKPHYVLLGGDDEIIPTRKCTMKIGPRQREIPADIYYSCLDSITFDWDSNKNGVYGEWREQYLKLLKDSVNLIPNFYISRAPVRTLKDAQVFVNRVLKYEVNHNPTACFLSTGVRLDDGSLNIDWEKYGDHSQAEVWGDELFKTYVQPYYPFAWNRFYDTSTSYGSNGPNVSATNLQSALTEGYDFVSIITHGYSDYLSLEPSEFYTNEHASTLENYWGLSIITTIACLTNAFDTWSEPDLFNIQHNDPCLSESFIRNPTSGVVAYLGCSREGWAALMNETTHGASFQFEASFYKNLFHNLWENKNFGKVVADAKLDLVTKAYDDNTYRWIYYGLNAMGDPEMPIYTVPNLRKFDNISITQNSDIITIDSGIDDGKISITGRNSSDNIFESHNGRSFSYKIKKDIIVTFTKQNYRPKSFLVTIENGVVTSHEITSIENFIKNGTILMSNHLETVCIKKAYFQGTLLNLELDKAPENQPLTLTISSINGLANCNYIVSDKCTTIDLTDFPRGVCSVSLSQNGNLIDSKTILKQ